MILSINEKFNSRLNRINIVHTVFKFPKITSDSERASQGA